MAFKVAKMREAIMEDQDEFLMRNPERTDVDVETNTRAQLEDVGQNAGRLQTCILPIKGLTRSPRRIRAGEYS